MITKIVLCYLCIGLVYTIIDVIQLNLVNEFSNNIESIKNSNLYCEIGFNVMEKYNLTNIFCWITTIITIIHGTITWPYVLIHDLRLKYYRWKFYKTCDECRKILSSMDKES